MILSILDIKKINFSIKKIILSYIAITILAIVFDRIYALFSHDVSSIYMNFMFLYPLLCGAIYYLILGLSLSKFKYKKFRFAFNIYNSGISIITVGSLLHGILEIAGTSSPYISWYSIVDLIFILSGLLMTLFNIALKN